MIVIAESGSSKTDWAVCPPDGSNYTLRHSPGINPYFITDTALFKMLKETFADTDTAAIEKLFFYGPGCSLSVMQEKLKKALSHFFVNATISVQSDLLAAGKAAFGSESGIICILGTGSNCGFYNGQIITYSPPSLGYLFGDEGSGAYLGKSLLTDFLNDEMPPAVKSLFETTYQTALQEILENTYSKPFPNRYLASFSCFLSKHIKHDYCQNTVFNAFDAFFTKRLRGFDNLNSTKVRFVGSVAYAFRDILSEVANVHKINFDKNTDVLKSPLEPLIKVHFKV